MQSTACKWSEGYRAVALGFSFVALDLMVNHSCSTAFSIVVHKHTTLGPMQLVHERGACTAPVVVSNRHIPMYDPIFKSSVGGRLEKFEEWWLF